MAFVNYYNYINKIGDYEVKISEDIKDTIHKNINEIANIIYNNANNKAEFHYSIQRYLCGMSIEYKLKSSKEYQMICGKLQGRIDVVWENNDNTIVCVIEIDSCRRLKSIRKLKSINAVNKIWIVYTENIEDLMEIHDKEKEIYVINLGKLIF